MNKPFVARCVVSILVHILFLVPTIAQATSDKCQKEFAGTRSEDIEAAILQYKQLQTLLNNTLRAADFDASSYNPTSIAALRSELNMRETQLLQLGIEKAFLRKPLPHLESIQDELKKQEKLREDTEAQTQSLNEKLDKDWLPNDISELKNETVTAYTFSANQKHLIVGSDKGWLYKVDIENGNLISQLEIAKGSRIESLSTALNASTVLVSAFNRLTEEQTIRTVNSNDFSLMNSDTISDPNERTFLLSPNGRVFVAGNLEGGLTLFNSNDFGSISIRPVRGMFQTKTTPARFSKTGRYLAIWVEYHLGPSKLKILDTENWKPLKSFTYSSSQTFEVEFSDDEKIISILTDGALRSLKVENGSQKTQVALPSAITLRGNFSDCGRYAMVGVNSGENVQSFAIHDQATNQNKTAHLQGLSAGTYFSISCDAQKIITNDRGKLRIWKTKSLLD